MLSGIKTGKKKRKAATNSSQSSTASGSKPTAAVPAASAVATSCSITSSSNFAMAQQLRANLASFQQQSGSKVDADGNNDKAAGLKSDYDLPHQMLERRGRIHDEATTTTLNTSNERGNGAEEVVVNLPGVFANDSSDQKLQAEKTNMSMDEELARNVVRLGKKRRQKMTSAVDSDEEEHRLLSMMIPSENKKKSKHGDADEKAKRRAMSRELAIQDRQEQIISKCWWWLESSKFEKHRLLSLGNHVSLVMAPLNLSLTPGNHFYIVPIKHAESLVNCEDEVWDEIVRFQTSLRNLFDKEYNKGVLFSEVVLPSKNFWQAKMEVIPIKKKIWWDSELYFKSTLAEQADDFGTHSSKLLSTKGKGLRRTVPKNFPYFYIEWDSPSQGYAQIIESSNFSPDFAVNTIAGMAGMDPISFQKKKKFILSQERQYILEFLEKWKSYDWTDQLDS